MSFTRHYFGEVARAAAAVPAEAVDEIAGLLFSAWEAEAAIFIMGNGGSASTSSHFACDLSKLTALDGARRWKVLSLTDNVSVMTAWANDAEYADIFVQQLAPHLRADDAVIGISGSGNSRNVLKALEYANAAGARTIAFTGFAGGRVKAVARHAVVVPSDSMQVIEDVHSLFTHAISLQLRAMMMDRLRTGRARPIEPRALREIY